jgi:Mn-dependent DtxR family transcriptional regulator
MTPQEKARELVNKYIPLTVRLIADYDWVEDIDSAKQCALIAVDQVIEMLDVVCESKSYDPFEAPMYDLKEWKQIKEEIEKL